jgi:hypothetical protein
MVPFNSFGCFAETHSKTWANLSSTDGSITVTGDNGEIVYWFLTL